MSGKLKFFAVQDLYQVGDRVRLKRAHAEYHLVNHNSKRPNISFVRVDLSFEHFGCHIDGRSKHSLGHFICRVEIFAETEISKFDNSIVEEYIVWLHVPVHNVVLVQYLKGLEKLLEDQE